jgi:hypothetical protein
MRGAEKGRISDSRAGTGVSPFWKNRCKYFIMTGPDGERLEFNQIL